MNLCIKRLTKEYKDLIENPLDNIKIVSDNIDIKNWFCMFYNLDDECYLNGEYIINIKFPKTYPHEPPDFYFLTPNGRFEINSKLCFSNTSYHANEWSPLWTLKTLILGLSSFFFEYNSKGIGHLNTTIEVKKKLANESKKFNETKLTNILKLFNDESII